MTQPAAMAAPPPIATVRGGGEFRRTRALVLLVGLMGLVVGVRVAMSAGWPLPPCAFLRWTGSPCATCGSTRALAALGRGDWNAAFGWNPLVALGVVASALAGLAAIFFPALTARWMAAGSSRLGHRRLLALLVASLCLNWIYVWVHLPR